jgi:hypothetical protein
MFNWYSSDVYIKITNDISQVILNFKWSIQIKKATLIEKSSKILSGMTYALT